MKGKRAVWTRVRLLEAERPATSWTGPLPIVCPQHWPADDLAAWEVAEMTHDEATINALVERHACVRPLPPEAGVRCIVIHHLPPQGDEAWSG
jgi:hypothetical protein